MHDEHDPSRRNLLHSKYRVLEDRPDRFLGQKQNQEEQGGICTRHRFVFDPRPLVESCSLSLRSPVSGSLVSRFLSPAALPAKSLVFEIHLACRLSLSLAAYRCHRETRPPITPFNPVSVTKSFLEPIPICSGRLINSTRRIFRSVLHSRRKRHFQGEPSRQEQTYCSYSSNI